MYTLVRQDSKTNNEYIKTRKVMQIELHSDTSEKGSSEIRLSETMPRKKPLV